MSHPALRSSRALGPMRLTFRRALVRDVAYESLPRNRRAQIHASVVTVVETDSNVGTVSSSRVGHHCAQAGLIAKAARYYRTGGGAFCGTRRAGRDQEPPGARVAIRTEPAGRSRSEVA